MGGLIFGSSLNLPSFGVLLFLFLFHKPVDFENVVLNNLLILLPHFLFKFLFPRRILWR